VKSKTPVNASINKWECGSYRQHPKYNDFFVSFFNFEKSSFKF
jgi:hypothetical protein